MSSATMINFDTANAPSPSGARKAAKAAAIPAETVEYLKAWMMSPEHVAHPYPTEQEKAVIMADTAIELKQLTNWFVNNRKRFWKPRVEAKLQKQNDSPAGSLPLPSTQMQGTGGLRISMLRLNPRFEQATSSIATMYNNAPDNMLSHSSAPLCVQGSGGQTLSSSHANFGPAVGALSAAAAIHENNPRTVSASSSACNSDDESVNAPGSNTNHSSFGATATQYLDSRLQASVDTSSMTSTTVVPFSGGYQRYEEVNVHILRPEGSLKGYHVDSEGALPSLRELTIKNYIPKERILASFKCNISYTIPYNSEHDRMKVRSRRNNEILRVKKHFLNLYLATRTGVRRMSSPVVRDARVPVMAPPSSASSTLPTAEASPVPSMVHAISPVKTAPAPIQISSSSRSRTLGLGRDNSVSNQAPRKRARTGPRSLLKGEEKWKKLCQSADNLYCESLPDLDEAARMFGYVSP